MKKTLSQGIKGCGKRLDGMSFAISKCRDKDVLSGISPVPTF